MDYFKPTMLYEPLAEELIRHIPHISGVYFARPSLFLVYNKCDFRWLCWEWSIPNQNGLFQNYKARQLKSVVIFISLLDCEWTTPNLPEVSHVTGEAGHVVLHRFSGVRPFNCGRLFQSLLIYLQFNLV